MAITEAVRTARTKRWQNHKNAWETKLAKADNENDKTVAAAMIAEAEGAIKRLESKDKIVQEEAMYDKQKTEPIVKKIKKDRASESGMEKQKTKTDTYPHKAKDSTDTTGTIGL